MPNGVLFESQVSCMTKPIDNTAVTDQRNGLSHCAENLVQ